MDYSGLDSFPGACYDFIKGYSSLVRGGYMMMVDRLALIQKMVIMHLQTYENGYVRVICNGDGYG